MALSTRSPRVLVPAVLLAVALLAPSFWIGFSLDDYIQYGLIEGWYDVEAQPPVNLYSSFLELPNLPWWQSEAARVAFWRPWPGVLWQLDHALFGRHPAFYHVHSLLWLAALVAVCGLLFARLPAAVGVPALFLVAVEEAHAMTSGLVCNRHATVTLVPALLGLFAHLRWREDGWRPGRLLGPAGFALALASSEAAVAALAYVAAYELWGPGSWRERLRAFAPFAVLALAYVAAYKALDLGPREVGFYLEPLRRPGEYVAALAIRVPALLAGLLAAFPVSLWMLPPMRTPLVVTGVAATLAAAAAALGSWRRLPEAERRAIRWWTAGALLSLPPLAAAMPSDRQLLVPAVGIAVALGAFFAQAWRHRRRFAGAAALALLALLHFVAAPVGTVAKQVSFVRLNAALMERVEDFSGLVAEAAPGAPHDVAVIAADFFTVAYPPLIHDYYATPGTWTWNVLSLVPAAHRLTRTGPRSFTLEPIGTAFLETELERAYRPREPLAAGDEARGPAFRAEVVAAGERGPTRVGFHFDRELERGSFHLIYWDEEGLREVRLPEVGETIVIERPADLMGVL